MKYLKLFNFKSFNESVNTESLFQKIDREEYTRIEENLSKVDFKSREEDSILDILISREIAYTKSTHIGYTGYEIRLLVDTGDFDRRSLEVEKYDDDYYVILYWTGKEWLLYKCDTFEGVKECLEYLFI
jgi:hypothetical protein